MKIWTHRCNENKYGHWFWASRWWLHFGYKITLGAEWHLFHKATSSPAVEFEWGHGDGDDGVMFNLCLPGLISLFVYLDGIMPRRLSAHSAGWEWPRETAIKFHDGSLWIHPFYKSMSWSSSDPWYVRGITLHISDWILGRARYFESDDSGWTEIVVPMPEKSYPGRVRIFTGNWKRRFGTKRIRRCEVKMDEPIPVPGKGENSWDCGEDATHGVTAPARHPHEAIAIMVEHAMRDRFFYGNGIHWRPEPKTL